jgi:hypothetical protein
MNEAHKQRLERIMPGGKPRYIRVYDNGGPDREGGSIDRYTVVFTGNYPGRGGLCRYVGMSGAPFHPQGFGQHGESETIIDRPTYGHLGKKITFADLPEDCQRLVISDYRYYWELCAVCGRPDTKRHDDEFLCPEHRPEPAKETV